MAAGLSFPSWLATGAFIAGDAAGEPYLIRGCPGANKIVLYLHTWSADRSQIMSMPELLSIDRACVVSPEFNGPNNTSAALGSDDSIDRINTVLQEVQYKTGLSRVYIVAASGGTLAAMNFMGRHPGKVHRASLWLPIFDLASLYGETSDASLQADMVSAIGHAPTSCHDADYASRSASSRVYEAAGPTTLFLNTGASDTTSPSRQGLQAAEAFKRVGFDVNYRKWPIGHVFGTAERNEAVKQLILE